MIPAGPLTARVTWVTGAILIGALYLGHASIFGGYVADDAGISLAYARNIAAGYGPVLYPGGEAVEGYSNPLWTAALALATALELDGADGVPLMKILGMLFGVATLILAGRTARIAYPGDSRVGWLAPALLASLTPFVFWTAAGMENGLYAFLLLLAVMLQLREVQDAGVRQWSALALACLALTRPEGAGLSAVFLLHRVICGERGLRLSRWAAAILIVYVAFLVARVAIFGELVPNTYYAKVAIYERRPADLAGYLLNPEDRGTAYVLDFAKSIWVLAVVAAAGLLAWRPWQTSLLITGLVAGTLVSVVYMGGDFWPAGRFFTALLPLLALAAQHAVNRISWPGAMTASLVAALLVAAVLNRSLRASADLHVQNAGDALISLQGRLENARRVQAMAAALRVEDPLVLDPDIGGPAVAGLRVLDLGGLTDIHIARFHYDPTLFREYVFEERRPDFIRTHATWTQSSRITSFPEFEAGYVAIQSWRDELGLHGEFVRRDLLDPHSHRRHARPARQPSWRQAIEDGRARREREDARAKQRGAAGSVDHSSDDR